jgi:hypothetical protein
VREPLRKWLWAGSVLLTPSKRIWQKLLAVRGIFRFLMIIEAGAPESMGLMNQNEQEIFLFSPKGKGLGVGGWGLGVRGWGLGVGEMGRWGDGENK